MARRFDAGYYISEGFHSIFTHGFMSFAAVCMIVACLIIMGSFTLLAVNLDNMLGDLENENEMLVYVDDSLNEEQARALQPKLAQVDNVSQLTFVTREAALEDFRSKRESNADLLDDLPDDTLRDRYRVHVVDIERMAQTKEALEDVEGVAWVRAAIEIADGFVLVRNIATGVALALVGVLLVVSLFIIANTIKLATFYRREEIAIMKMCGATDGFVRGPFIVEGLILGVMGAAAAFLIQWAVYAAVCRAFVESGAVTLFTLMEFKEIWTQVLGIFLTAGAAIGAVGSGFAIRRFLQV